MMHLRKETDADSVGGGKTRAKSLSFNPAHGDAGAGGRGSEAFAGKSQLVVEGISELRGG